MAEIHSLIGAHGLTDDRDRLLHADEPLAELQERCGGTIPGMLAIPELLDLVQQGRRMGLRLAREFTAFDGEALITGFARIHPQNESAGGGCEVLVENWRRGVRQAPGGRDFGAQIDAIDRATAEVHARLDARQGVQVLSTLAPDAATLSRAAMAESGRLWTDLVELSGLAHRQPLHWRLLDGATCRFAGSERHWRVRLIPLGGDDNAGSGFELLLIADEPLDAATTQPDAQDEADMLAPSRLIGSALTPVLRQPIARIIANAETIRSRLAGPIRPEYCDYAAIIASAGEHLSVMLDDLADLEVVETPGFAAAREPVDLADAVRRAVGILGVKAHHKDIAIAVAGGAAPVVAIAEFRRVLQVLINLIGNAIAYSPAGTTVRIALEPSAQGIAALSVADEGPGIPADQANRIWEKHNRAGRDSAGGTDMGSGLGLYISRRLVEAMAGTISYAPAPGGGALFRVELPTA